MSCVAALPPLDSPVAVIERLAARGVLPTGVADDSRQVRPGDLFIAYPGDQTDGRQYIADAVGRGAAAVLWEVGNDFLWNPAHRVVNMPGRGVRQLCGPLAHAIFGQPSERLSLIAITGTNGKTSISQWLGRTHPRSCAIIGTLGAGFVDRLTETGFTTPEATVLTRYLAEFAKAEAHACALEASSIGIEEGRLDGVRVDVAVFTNLTRDHLDYHGTMDNYAAAKQRLFTWPRLRLAIVNLDDPFGAELARLSTASRVIGYTQNAATSTLPAVICAENVEESIDGLRFLLGLPNGRIQVETGLFGRYNVSNLLAVAAILFDAGLTPKDIAARFAELSAPPGRLERIGFNPAAAPEERNQPLVIVDYAHTPAALESALNALRSVAQARGASLVVVFGCGGDRDRGKRPLMGEVATRLADRVVLTTDNPRSEQALSIINDIRVSAPNADVIVDRAEAIHRTVLAAHPADVILLAGKGHEQYQEIAGERRPFSDVVEARAAMVGRLDRRPGS